MGRKRLRFTEGEYPEIQRNTESQMVSEYERSREERIKENLERMQKLGIFNLANQVKSLRPSPKSTPPPKRSHFSSSPLSPLGPSRRSSRLQGSTPKCYSELKVAKREKYLGFEEKLLRLEGSITEVYTDEHEKLLGSTEQSWELFKDGCGKDGKRIYDQVNGKSCHNCRQKTLGHRTHCSKCHRGQGQLCGDCLYIRYGEHILEAKQNPNWICPVCRGICNCSLCRHAKGWRPTGPIFRKISALGYKSIAHYLIQTKREIADSDDMKTKVPLSAKRSLPFETETVSSMETSESNFNPPELVDDNSNEVKSSKRFSEDIGEKSPEKTRIAFEAPEDCQELPGPKVVGTEASEGRNIHSNERVADGNNEVGEVNGVSSSELILFNDDPKGVTEVKEDEMEKTPISKKKRGRAAFEQIADSIAGRLRQRRPLNGVSSSELILFNDDVKDVTKVKEVEKKKTPISKKKIGRAIEPIVDSIGGRLRQRRSRIN